jgi:predicted nucleic acid-binding protein
VLPVRQPNIFNLDIPMPKPLAVASKHGRKQDTLSLANGNALSKMEKYKDVRMDFADATLVVLAEEMGITEIFTLDAKGFSTYRIHRTKTFRLWP